MLKSMKKICFYVINHLLKKELIVLTDPDYAYFCWADRTKCCHRGMVVNVSIARFDIYNSSCYIHMSFLSSKILHWTLCVSSDPTTWPLSLLWVKGWLFPMCINLHAFCMPMILTVSHHAPIQFIQDWVSKIGIGFSGEMFFQ